MFKQYWMISIVSLGALLPTSPVMADEILIPWAPAVIDSDEQAQTERRARAQALESLRSPVENSEEAWMKKFNPEPEEETVAEESASASRHSVTGKASAKGSTTSKSSTDKKLKRSDSEKPMQNTRNSRERSSSKAH